MVKIREKNAQFYGKIAKFTEKLLQHYCLPQRLNVTVFNFFLKIFLTELFEGVERSQSSEQIIIKKHCVVQPTLLQIYALFYIFSSLY